ncbi:MAG TPA: SAM-dependent methyltransferase [Ohtaekwangia sp.]|nr:SAM-dependent methyltransferase [Ohtaekwangia sp.]
MLKGKVYLIPNIIAENTQDAVIPQQVGVILKDIGYFLAEDVRNARRYLSSLRIYESIASLRFEVLDKDTPGESLADLMKPVFAGQNIGILSESGCPGIADPGALAVKYAHAQGIQVIPLVGPSSILLALMASGMNGQRFAFHGYLPIEQKEAIQVLKQLERESKSKNQTQIFIETPYRNNSLMKILLQTLQDDTLLCVALGVNSKDEDIKTRSVRSWKSDVPGYPKTPAVFLFLAG